MIHILLTRRRQLWLGSLLVVLCESAGAWNAGGHRLTAVIAWHQMSPGGREEALNLLAMHPARPSWESRLKDGQRRTEGASLAMFAEASTWADDLRRESNQSGMPSNPAIAANRDWHFVNWSTDQGALVSRGGHLDRELAAQATRLADRSLPAPDRSIALAWLIHLVADAHQPLHVASWSQPDGGHDDGGLEYRVTDNLRPKLPEYSLHTWWDDLPGPSWLRGDRLNQYADALLLVYPTSGISQGGPDNWLAESLTLARSSVRPPPTPGSEPWPISEDYRSLAKKNSQRRLAESGVRLGRLLERILGPTTTLGPPK